MGVTITDGQLKDWGLTAEQLRVELAVLLYRDGRVTTDGATELTGRPRHEVERLITEHGIPLRNDAEERQSDLELLRRLRSKRTEQLQTTEGLP
jgi:predicted HTH domain antitoxin